VASNLDCVGLGVASEEAYVALLSRALPRATPVGSAGGVELHRFEDPSGARLAIAVNRSGEIANVLPSFAAPREVQLVGLYRPNPDTAIADLVDDAGEQYGQLAVELEERDLLGAPSRDPRAAALVAFGVDVQVFADADAFAADPASLLVQDADPAEPRPDDLPPGVSWPVRVSSSSFMSYGVWNQGDDVEAYANLAGVVESAELRIVDLTGGRFIAARVQSLFPTTVCLSADDHAVPEPGAVIAGTVFMVGSVELDATALHGAEAAEPAAKRPRFSLFRRGR
jgi:hypothetical protein